MLLRGTQAPDFSLYSTPDQKITLSEFKGKRVILAFYPADWSPVCEDQLVLYNEALSLFKKSQAILFGISVDSKWSHLAFLKSRKLRFPLLADFMPRGKVAKMYDVYNGRTGEAQRVLYLIDENGIIFWNYLSPTGINPGADGILEALGKMARVSNTSFTTLD